MRHRYSEEEAQQSGNCGPRSWFGGRGRGLGGPRGFGRHGGRGPHGRGFNDGDDGPMKRILGHGDLRFLLLALLKEKPRHGYELIKLLEEKSGGHYTPSPGVIYPTLTYLEEAGFAKSETIDNKKQFAITASGVEELKTNQKFVDAILERMNAVRERLGEQGQGLRSVFMNMRSLMFSLRSAPEETKTKAAKILEDAIEQIKKITE